MARSPFHRKVPAPELCSLQFRTLVVQRFAIVLASVHWWKRELPRRKQRLWRFSRIISPLQWALQAAVASLKGINFN